MDLDFDQLLAEDGGVQNMNKTSGPAAGILVEVADAPLLQNRKAPQYIRQQELPNHRVIIELSAKGYTAREIAKLVDQSPTQVQDILRQPQYQQNIANTIRRVQGVDEEIVMLIKEEVVNSVKTMVEIRDNPNTPDATRLAAADKILERRYGKANQPINQGSTVDLATLDIAEIASQLPPANN